MTAYSYYAAADSTTSSLDTGWEPTDTPCTASFEIPFAQEAIAHEAFIVSFGAEMVNSEDEWCYTTVEFLSGTAHAPHTIRLLEAQDAHRIAAKKTGHHGSSHSRSLLVPLKGLAIGGAGRMRMVHRVSGGIGTFSNRWVLVQPAVGIQDNEP